MHVYRHELMDHYRFPRNRGKVAQADFVSHEYNPSCGDAVCMSGRFQDGLLVEVAFEGTGCVISQATASLLTNACSGQSRDFINNLDNTALVQLVGMELGPTRLRCALLPLQALKQGVAQTA